MADGLAFDPFALSDDGVGSAEVGIGGCDVAQAFVVTAMVVMLDERLDLGLKVTGQEGVSSRMRFLRVRCQRSILPWVWGGR